MNTKKVIGNIRRELKAYCGEIYPNIKSLVLGISGGIDSAVVAALVRPVCDELDIPLIGRSLPILSNKKDEITRARAIGESLCHDFEEKDMGKAYLNLRGEIQSHWNETTEGENIRLGNIKARIRMIYLYNLAHKSNGIVLSTDNWSELMLGFWTVHGDVGDYGCIQNLSKTEVYILTDELIKEQVEKEAYSAAQALKDCKEAIPTDGLGITNSDYEQLNISSYQEADEILKRYTSYRCINAEEYDTIQKELDKLREHRVIKRYESTHYKRNNPYNIPRETLMS